MHCTDGGTVDIGIHPSQSFPDLGRTPVRILLLEVYDQLLDLYRQLVGMAVGPPTAICQTIDAAVLVAVIDLVAGH